MLQYGVAKYFEKKIIFNDEAKYMRAELERPPVVHRLTEGDPKSGSVGNKEQLGVTGFAR